MKNYARLLGVLLAFTRVFAAGADDTITWLVSYEATSSPTDQVNPSRIRSP